MQNNGAVEQKATANPISSWALEDRLKPSLALVPESSKRMLDAGCGEGYFLSKLAGNGRELHGIDISEKNVEVARSLVPDASTAVGDITRIPYPDGYFDCVSALEILDHLAEPEKALSEMRRVLRNGGSLVMSVPDCRLLRWRVIWALWTKTMGTRWHGAHVLSFTEDSLRGILHKEGFELEEMRRALFGCIMVVRARRK